MPNGRVVPVACPAPRPAPARGPRRCRAQYPLPAHCGRRWAGIRSGHGAPGARYAARTACVRVTPARARPLPRGLRC